MNDQEWFICKCGMTYNYDENLNCAHCLEPKNYRNSFPRDVKIVNEQKRSQKDEVELARIRSYDRKSEVELAKANSIKRATNFGIFVYVIGFIMAIIVLIIIIVVIAHTFKGGTIV